METFRIPFLLAFFRNLILNTALLFFPLYFLNLGFNSSQIGFLLSLLQLTSLLLSFFIGIGNDRITPRTWIILGSLILVAFYSLLNLSASFGWMIIAFLVGGFGINILSRSLDALVFKIVKKKDQGQKLGLYQALTTGGTLAGIVLGSFFIYKFSFHFAFLLALILSIALVIVSLTLQRTSENNYPVKSYFKDLLQKKIIIFCIILFLFALHWGAEYTSYTPFLKNNLGLSQLGIGIYMILPLCALIFFSYYLGKRVDKGMPSKNLLYLGVLLSGIGILFMALTTDVVFSMFFRIIHEIGDASFAIFIYYGIAEFFKKDRVGGDSGFVNLVLVAATFTGNLIYGPIGYNLGYQWPHIISGILSLMIFGILLVWKR